MVGCNSEETKAEEKEELLSLRCELEKKLPEVEKELHRGRRELSIWQTFPLKLRTVGVSNILQLIWNKCWIWALYCLLHLFWTRRSIFMIIRCFFHTCLCFTSSAGSADVRYKSGFSSPWADWRGSKLNITWAFVRTKSVSEQNDSLNCCVKLL